ncbi:MAG: hypothetical protein IJH39_02185 [Clostridia bacterium]|nr:hypothetical protein [Clostridia bacterium]
MERDYAGDMMALEEKLQQESEKIQKINSIKYLGGIGLIDLNISDKYEVYKNIYLASVVVLDEEGNEKTIDKYYTEDLQCIAMEDEQYEKCLKMDPLMLENEYAQGLENVGLENENDKLKEKLRELDKEGIIDLDKIREENLPKVLKVAKTLGIDKENIDNLSEIDLEKLQNPDMEDKIKANSQMSIDVNTHVTTKDTMESLLNVQGRNYKTIDIVYFGNSLGFVGTKADGTMENITTLVNRKGNRPNKKINALNEDGSKIEKENVITEFDIFGTGDEYLAIGMGKMNTLKVSYVRESPDTYEAISIPVETIARTRGNVKEFMDPNRNQSVSEETRRIKQQKEQGEEPINLYNIDDDPLNNEYDLDEEFIPGTDTTWKEYAGRLKISIQEAKEKFVDEKENNPNKDNVEILEDIEDRENEEFIHMRERGI